MRGAVQRYYCTTKRLIFLFSFFFQVYSAEVLAGNVGNLEMYDTVSKAVIRVKREKIISVGHETSMSTHQV